MATPDAGLNGKVRVMDGDWICTTLPGLRGKDISICLQKEKILLGKKVLLFLDKLFLIISNFIRVFLLMSYISSIVPMLGFLYDHCHSLYLVLIIFLLAAYDLLFV